jgi:hypothetical protein
VLRSLLGFATLAKGGDAKEADKPNEREQRPASLVLVFDEETFMRRILPVAIAIAALSVSNTGTRADGTWCAHYGTGLDGMNCGFYSFEQCRATVSGVGGFCLANLSSAYAAARDPRRRYRRNY